jgi:hypothetical protein
MTTQILYPALSAMSRPQIGIDRLPTRRVSNEPREAMNCKSCRKRKVPPRNPPNLKSTSDPGRSSATGHVRPARPVKSSTALAFTVPIGLRTLCSSACLTPSLSRCRAQKTGAQDRCARGPSQARGWSGEASAFRRQERKCHRRRTRRPGNLS